MTDSRASSPARPGTTSGKRQLHAPHTKHAVTPSALTDVEAQRILAIVNLAIERYDVLCATLLDKNFASSYFSTLQELQEHETLDAAVAAASASSSLAAAADNSVSGNTPSLDNSTFMPLKYTVKSFLSACAIHDESASGEMRESMAARVRSEFRALARKAGALDTSSREFTAAAGVAAARLPADSAAASIRRLLVSTRWLMFERMTRTVSDEEATRIELQRCTEREKKISAELKTLRSKVEAARTARLREIGAKNEYITKLREQLAGIKKNAEESIAKLDLRARMRLEGDNATHMIRLTEQEEALDAATRGAAAAEQANREEELALRKKTLKIEAEVDAWIHKYDVEMDEKQVEIDAIAAIYNDEQNSLKELIASLEALEKKHKSIQDYRSVAEDLRLRREQQQKRRNNAACRIQAAFRGYRVRKQLKEAQKQQKDKKKKSAKGKKAKK